MRTYHEDEARKELRARSERLKAFLPSVVEPPDNVYLEGVAGSWEFALDDHRATRNFMAAGASHDFSANEGDEIITFINPVKNASLQVEISDREKTPVAHTPLRREGDRVQIAAGYSFKLTTDAAVVEYVIEYPAQKPIAQTS